MKTYHCSVGYNPGHNLPVRGLGYALSFGNIRTSQPLSWVNAIHTTQLEVAPSVETLSCFLSWLLGVPITAMKHCSTGMGI